MAEGRSRIGIDIGAVSCAAVTAGPDGVWTPVLLDGLMTCPSVVAVTGSGALVAGHDAEEIKDDTRVAAPVRRRVDEVVPVGGRRFDSVELVAALLRHL